MRFTKVVVVGIDETKLEPAYWQRIESLADVLQRVDVVGEKLVVDADCLLVGFETVVDAVTIEKMPNLKYIGVLGTAYDRVDVAAAKDRGVIVTNLPGYSTEAVAEWVFGVLLEHLRNLSRAKQEAAKGNYGPAGFSGSEIMGKVFGVVGLGRIGTRVVEIALGFNADVRYWSRTRKNEMETRGVKYEELDELVRQADFLSLHVTGTSDTENLLNRERIMGMKTGAIIVNTVSMRTIDVDALEERLKRGDVTLIRMHSRSLTGEQWKRLSRYQNMVVYPAFTNVTNEANQAREEMFVRNVERFLAGKPENVIN
ncbi:MAG: hypothetical protein HY420_00605 [Candidatus Kerfeldbacteria bacterium]|nr:hypothetical protein [Candidatus Kerfeldbacteria bacterium]